MKMEAEGLGYWRSVARVALAEEDPLRRTASQKVA